MKFYEPNMVVEAKKGKEFLSGGSFGAEGGIIVTGVLSVAIVILFIYMKKTKKIIS